MTERLIIAGAGGQGIMLMGKVLAEAAMRESRSVTWLPAYGAEVRGGTAFCMVVISDQDVGSPYIDVADTMIIMNEPSRLRFLPRLKSQGCLFLNSDMASLPKSIKKFCVCEGPYTSVAARLGNIKVANMVALGSYIASCKIVRKTTVLKVMSDFAPKGKEDIYKINEDALNEGMGLVNGTCKIRS